MWSVFLFCLFCDLYVCWSFFSDPSPLYYTVLMCFSFVFSLHVFVILDFPVLTCFCVLANFDFGSFLALDFLCSDPCLDLITCLPAIFSKLTFCRHTIGCLWILFPSPPFPTVTTTPLQKGHLENPKVLEICIVCKLLVIHMLSFDIHCHYVIFCHPQVFPEMSHLSCRNISNVLILNVIVLDVVQPIVSMLVHPILPEFKKFFLSFSLLIDYIFTSWSTHENTDNAHP